MIVIPDATPALFFLRLLQCVTLHHYDDTIFPSVCANSGLYFGPLQCVTLIHIYHSSRPLSSNLFSLLLCVSGIRKCVITYAALVGDGGSRSTKKKLCLCSRFCMEPVWHRPYPAIFLIPRARHENKCKQLMWFGATSSVYQTTTSLCLFPLGPFTN